MATSKKPQTIQIPAVGDVAPDFKGLIDEGETLSLSSLRGKLNVVLYFYPKDNTPGCTRQACAFQESLTKIKNQDGVVIGISPDSLSSHGKFREKFGLKFYLISDTEHKIADLYGAWTLKKNYGKTYMGIQRSTFIINKKGVITHVWPKVSVDGHDEDVLQALKTLK